MLHVPRFSGEQGRAHTYRQIGEAGAQKKSRRHSEFKPVSRLKLSAFVLGQLLVKRFCHQLHVCLF